MARQRPEDDPSTTSAAYNAMSPRLERANRLLGGTDAMRGAGQDFLPMHAEETSRGWNDRLHNNVLFNYYEITLDQLAGKPFSEPIALGSDIPSEILPHLEDINLQGDSLDAFSYEWFRDGIRAAVSCILVDFPRPNEEENEGVRTRADDLSEGRRPYWVHVPLERILYARTEIINGIETVVHVRIYEEVAVPNGFTDEFVPQIRVLEPGEVFLYRKKDAKKTGSDWYLYDSYQTDLDFIPLVPFYTDREAPFMGRPLLDDLAFLNVRHWQSMSDQIRSLTVARFPMLVLKGVYENEKEFIKAGPEQTLVLPENGSVFWLEAAGSALQQGRDELFDLEERMSAYGAQVLRKKPSVQTATARVLDSSESLSVIQASAISFQSAVEQALLYHAMWMGLDNGGSVKVQTNFHRIEDSSQQVLLSLKDAHASRVISTTTYTGELQRLGVLSEDYNFGEDQQKIEEEVAMGLRAFASIDLDPEGGEETPIDNEEDVPE